MSFCGREIMKSASAQTSAHARAHANSGTARIQMFIPRSLGVSISRSIPQAALFPSLSTSSLPLLPTVSLPRSHTRPPRALYTPSSIGELIPTSFSPRTSSFRVPPTHVSLARRLREPIRSRPTQTAALFAGSRCIFMNQTTKLLVTG